MSEQTEPEVETQEPEAPQVNPDAYEQVKNDMFKYKREAQEAAKEAEKLREAMKAKEDEVLQQNNQYKELYERTVKDLESVKSEKTEFVSAVMEDKKLAAVREYALQKGISEMAMNDLGLLNMEGVVVETTSEGRINVLGADTYVENLKKTRPHWFSNGTPPRINNGTGDPQVEDKTYTPNELLKLQKENPAKYREIILKKKDLIKR